MLSAIGSSLGYGNASHVWRNALLRWPSSHPLTLDAQYANSAFALAAQFYIMRIGRFYAVSKTFGPILLMIKLMLVRRCCACFTAVLLIAGVAQGDMLVFLSIILLLGIGYGVAMYTLIFPEREWDDITIAKVFYR